VGAPARSSIGAPARSSIGAPIWPPVLAVAPAEATLTEAVGATQRQHTHAHRSRSMCALSAPRVHIIRVAYTHHTRCIGRMRAPLAQRSPRIHTSFARCRRRVWPARPPLYCRAAPPRPAAGRMRAACASSVRRVCIACAPDVRWVCNACAAYASRMRRIDTAAPPMQSVVPTEATLRAAVGRAPRLHTPCASSAPYVRFVGAPYALRRPHARFIYARCALRMRLMCAPYASHVRIVRAVPPPCLARSAAPLCRAAPPCPAAGSMRAACAPRVRRVCAGCASRVRRMCAGCAPRVVHLRIVCAECAPRVRRACAALRHCWLSRAPRLR